VNFDLALGDGAAWGHPYSVRNSLDILDFTMDRKVFHVVDMGVAQIMLAGRVYAENRRLIVLCLKSVSPTPFGKIFSYDPITLEKKGESSISHGFTSGGGEEWRPTALLAYGQYVYVSAYDHAATGVEPHRIQKFILSDTTGAWTVDPSWPATGRLLGNNGAVLGLNSYYTSIPTDPSFDRIAHVASGTLAVLNSWVPVTAANSPLIEVLQESNGTVLTYGAGDASISANRRGAGGLVSDGVNVFFTTYDHAPGSGKTEVGSAQVADADSGSGLANLPATSVPTGQYRGLAFDGDVLWWGVYNKLNAYFRRAATPSWVTVQDGSGGTSIPQGEWLAFDGRVVWSHAWVNVGGGVRDGSYLIGFPCSALEPNSVQETYCLDPDYRHALLMQGEQPPGPIWWHKGRMCFDGDSVWVVLDQRSGMDLSGIVRRVPRVTR
jgi:hypothetical protein